MRPYFLKWCALALLAFLVLMASLSFSVSAQNTHESPSAYSPAGIMALDRQIRAALARQEPQEAWALARLHLDFQYMPAEMLLQIAQLAQFAQSSERALAIVQRALQSFPEHPSLHHYGLVLARQLHACDFATTQQAYYQRPHKIAWRAEFNHFRELCTNPTAHLVKNIQFQVYRGTLPYHGGRTDIVRAAPNSYLASLCASEYLMLLCPASLEFKIAERPPDINIFKTGIEVRKAKLGGNNIHTELKLNWQHYQTQKLNVFADDVEIGMQFTWPERRQRQHQFAINAGAYASQPPASQSAYHTQRVGANFTQTNQLVNIGWGSELNKIRPDKWGWKAAINQHLRPNGSLSTWSISEFQSWDLAAGTLIFSLGSEFLDYPASALAGDARAHNWQLDFQHHFADDFAGDFANQFEGGLLHNIVLSYRATALQYARALPWLEHPHQLKRATVRLSLTFAEVGTFGRPTIGLEQITSRSANQADHFKDQQFLFTLSKKF